MFLQLVVSGLVNGAVYALIALGLVVMYKSTEIVNFAQGEMVMLGAFFGLTASTTLGLPYPLAFVAAVLAAAIVGWLVDRVLFRPLYDAPLMILVLATFAISNILRGTARVVWGTETHAYERSTMMVPVRVGQVIVTRQQMLILAGGLALMAGLYVFFRRSWWGKGMRAMSQNRIGASLSGIGVSQVFSLTWVLSGILGAAAGVLFAPLTLIDADIGWIIIKAFAAAILGGFDSLPGAVLGGLMLGVVENLSGRVLPVVWVPMLAYVFIILVLLVRPSGLLGKRVMKKV